MFRFHRKWFVYAISACVVLVLLAVACAPATAPALAPATFVPLPVATSAPAPTAAPSGGSAANTLVIDMDTSDMITLDPGVGYEFTDDLITHNVYETLVKFEGVDLSTIKPGLATKWDIKDAGDQWQVTFTLRSDAKFSSGNPVTADDVVYSFQRVISLNKSPAFLFTDDLG